MTTPKPTAAQKKAVQDKYVASQQKLFLDQISNLFGRALTATEIANVKTAVQGSYAVGTAVWDAKKKKFVNKAPADAAAKYTAAIQAASGVKGQYNATAKAFQALDKDNNVVTDRSKWADAPGAAANNIYKTIQGSVQTNFSAWSLLLNQMGQKYADELLRIAAGSTSEAEFKNKFYLSEAYKARFPGMDAFRKDHPGGTEADYIAIESAYSKALSDYGLDNDSVFGTSGSYQVQVPDPKDPNKTITETKTVNDSLEWQRYKIGQIMQGGVSVQEFNQRAKDAHDFTINADPAIKKTLQTLYGVSDTDLKAWILNPEVREQSIAKLESAATLGATALKGGMTLGGPRITSVGAPSATATGNAVVPPTSLTPQGEYSSNPTGDVVTGEYLQGLAGRSLGANATVEDRQRALSSVNAAVAKAGSERDTANLLAGIGNEGFTQQEQIEAQLSEAGDVTADANAAKKRQRLASQERARFSGSSGGTQILGQNLSGSF